MFEVPKHSSSWVISREFVISVVVLWIGLAVLFPAIFFFGYGAESWQRRSADRANCEACDCFHQNGCWDGRFKGSYPTNGYKSIWFNLDLGMAFIWGDLVLYIALTLECIKAIIRAWPNLAWGPFFCFALLVYPNFYGFWSVFTYINDRNWNLLDNQLFFCVTEAVAAWLCVWLMDQTRPSAPQIRAKGIVAGIAASHIVLALIDQLRGGYFVLAPHSYQRLRDVFLLIPEVAVMALLARKQSMQLVLKCVAIIVPLSLLWFQILPVKLFLAWIS